MLIVSPSCKIQVFYMNKDLAIIIGVIAIALIAYGFLYYTYYSQQAVSAPSEEITIVDDLNRTVKIPGHLHRIVSTMRIVSDVLLLFPEARINIVGIDAGAKDTPLNQIIAPFIANAEVVSTSKRDVNVETILSLEPDIVFAKDYQENILKPLEDSNIPVVYLSLEKPEVFLKDIELLGKILREENTATKIINYYNGKLEYLKSHAEKVVDKPRVLVVYYSTKGGIAYKAPGKDWLQNYLVKLTGAYSLSDMITGSGWKTLNVEQIIDWNPDIIFVVTYRLKNPSSVEAAFSILNDTRLKDVSAVKNGRVYPIPNDGMSWDMPIPRWILCALWMAKYVSPKVYSDMNLTEETIAFYEKIYNISRSDAEKIFYDYVIGGRASISLKDNKLAVDNPSPRPLKVVVKDEEGRVLEQFTVGAGESKQVDLNTTNIIVGYEYFGWPEEFSWKP